MSRARGWRECFPALAATAEPELQEILDAAPVVELGPEQQVFSVHGACESYLLVLDGDVRVQLISRTGREVTLYHVRRGHPCVLTTACLMSGDDYPADAVTEGPVRALALSRREFDHAMDRSRTFRRFVFEGFGQRLSEMMRRMDDVTFGDIDARLARLLVTRADEKTGAPSGVTHQMLAVELGTAREVVSRHLKRFEKRGWVELRRGSIRIAARDALERIAEPPP